MADLNPVRLLRRLLSLPNDSTAKTLGMAFAVSAVCALVVSVAGGLPDVDTVFAGAGRPGGAGVRLMR